jgi:hypothetical protein
MPNTADAQRPLLHLLSDDELARYGEIARDQAASEFGRWWLQLAFVLASAATLLLTLVRWGVASIEALGIEAVGFGTSIVTGLGSAIALAYLPYRWVRNWTLWNRHCKAVRDEQERRLTMPQRG